MKTNKNKELQFKISVILGAISGTLLTVFAFLGEINMDNEVLYSKYEKYMLVSMVPSIISLILILYFAGKTKITYPKVQPEKIKILSNDYPEFEERFLLKLQDTKYSEYRDVNNKMNCQIKYLIQKTFSKAYIILIIKAGEITDDIYNNYFNESLKYIAEQEKSILTKEINLFHILCVDKENENFKKFVETNVEQGYERLNLPIGISFENKTIYIPKQKGGLYIKKYIKLVEIFKQYIENQLK